MSKPPAVLHLEQKLRLLYNAGLNPSINCHSDLAKYVGVSRQAVSKWIRGTETSRGGSVPNEKLFSIAHLFSVERSIFKLGLESFQAHLDSKTREIREQANAYSGSIEKGEPRVFVSCMPLTKGKCVGRNKGLEMLNAAWTSDNTNLVQITGIGGMGKSMLVNTWINDLAKSDYSGARNVYAWSFNQQYGTGESNRSSADLFIESALNWYGDPSYLVGSSWSKAIKLLDLIRKYRSLLVLDGVESLLRTPVNGLAELEDNSLNMLIRELMRDFSGLCIVTSRVPLAIVDASNNSFIQIYQLPELDHQNSILLLESLGVKNINGERLECAIKYNLGHPLCLKLLAGYVSVVHCGDLRKWDTSVFMLSRYQKESEMENLMDSYLRWFENLPELAILLLLSFFDGPVGLPILQSFAEALEGADIVKDLDGIDFDTWRFALNELEKTMLITCAEPLGKSLVECHPLIRQHLVDFLKRDQPADWINGHGVLFELFSQEEVADLDSIASLEPWFQSVSHGCLANRHIEAFKIYNDKIKNGQLYITPLGSHQTDLDFIRPFFKKTRVAWTETVNSLPNRAKFGLLTYAATNLIYLGNIDLAIAPISIGIEGFISEKDWLSAAITAVPLYSMLLYTGKMIEAQQLYKKMQPHLIELDNPVALAMSDTLRAFYYHLSGNDELASKLFKQAHNVLSQKQAPNVMTFPIINYFHTMFLIETKGARLGLARAQQTFAWRETGSWQCGNDTKILLAMDHLCMGYSKLLLGDFEEASFHLNEQVIILRETEDWMYLPHALNYRSLLYIQIGDYESAIIDLNESLEIANRTGAKFIEWNARINYCQYYISRGKLEDLRIMYNKAQKLLDGTFYKVRVKDIKAIEDYLSNGC